MKRVNASVIEAGKPFYAVYIGTHPSNEKHYMEVKYGNMQSRKWVAASKVTLEDGIAIRYGEKMTDFR